MTREPIPIGRLALSDDTRPQMERMLEQVDKGYLDVQIDQRTGKPMKAVQLVRDQECWDAGYAAGIAEAARLREALTTIIALRQSTPVRVPISGAPLVGSQRALTQAADIALAALKSEPRP